MWRPKDWDKTLRRILDNFGVTYMNSEECKLVEAGAGAMLVELRKYGSDVPEGLTNRRGKLIFIPDEE